MPTLELFVIGIDRVRDIFRADPDLAAHLRAVAVERFVAPTAPPRTLLGKLGPLFRRAPETEVRLGGPIPRDVEALLTGAFVDPDRAEPSWQVLLAWLERLAPAHAVLTFDDLDALDYDLARAGLPSEVSLRSLAARDLGVPLRPVPGQFVGYGKHQQWVETRDGLREVIASPEHGLEEETLRAVETLVGLFDDVPADATPPPDLVVIQPPGDVTPR